MKFCPLAIAETNCTDNCAVCLQEEIKDIVFTGLKQGWAYSNILGQIKYRLATKEESETLFICGEDSLPKLTEQAEKLYQEYREKYYEGGVAL